MLQNRGGHVALLSDLVNREMASPQPSDVVLFLGPASRYMDKVPESWLDKPASQAQGPHFFYMQYRPMFPPMQAVLPDTIGSAVSRLRGKTLIIRTPGDFAKAIEQLEKPDRQSAGELTRWCCPAAYPARQRARPGPRGCARRATRPASAPGTGNAPGPRSRTTGSVTGPASAPGPPARLAARQRTRLGNAPGPGLLQKVAHLLFLGPQIRLRVSRTSARQGTRSTTVTPAASAACTFSGLFESRRIFFNPKWRRMAPGSS